MKIEATAYICVREPASKINADLSRILIAVYHLAADHESNECNVCRRKRAVWSDVALKRHSKFPLVFTDHNLQTICTSLFKLCLWASEPLNMLQWHFQRPVRDIALSCKNKFDRKVVEWIFNLGLAVRGALIDKVAQSTSTHRSPGTGSARWDSPRLTRLSPRQHTLNKQLTHRQYRNK